MRRKFLKTMACGAFGLLSACAPRTERSKPHVVVVGGGFAGATLAKYLRVCSQGDVAVTLVERNRQFVSCPISNLVLAGQHSLADITLAYAGLSQLGVEVIHAQAERIDPEKRRVLLSGGISLSYDRCVLAPGVDFITEDIPGLASETAQRLFPHAYKAGPQTCCSGSSLQPCPMAASMPCRFPKFPTFAPPGPMSGHR